MQTRGRVYIGRFSFFSPPSPLPFYHPPRPTSLTSHSLSNCPRVPTATHQDPLRLNFVEFLSTMDIPFSSLLSPNAFFLSSLSTVLTNIWWVAWSSEELGSTQGLIHLVAAYDGKDGVMGWWDDGGDGVMGMMGVGICIIDCRKVIC